MKKLNRFLITALAGCGVTFNASAFYHEELRHAGKLDYLVGWYPDPPYAGETQQMMLAVWWDGRPIIVSDNDPKKPGTHPEDKVEVKLTLQRLSNPSPKAKVLEEVTLPGRFREFWKGENYYGISLYPRTPGPIAVVLQGEVNGVSLDGERFVCKPPEQLHREKSDGISCIQDRKEALRIGPVPLKPYSVK